MIDVDPNAIFDVAFSKSSRKNAVAVIWPAISVGLGALSILVSKWP